MKKVGILTFHFCDNYGAVLQCYALLKVINSMERYNCEVINYNPNWKPRWFTDPKMQEKFLAKLEKYVAFRRDFLAIQEGYIYDTSEIKAYDYYVVGSDQVWNTSFRFSKPTYFLDFVPDNAVKVSYAASVGLAIEDKRLNRTYFEQYIPRFDYLSIREKTHEQYIKEFTDKSVTTVLDPTLLLRKEDYDEIISRDKEEKEKFIFLYFLKHDTTAPLMISFVNMLSRKYNLKVIHYFIDVPKQAFKNNSESFFFEGPQEFLWYIKNAEVVVTNSFHGTIFAIQYHKPFYTYVVKSMSSRVLDLLQMLGLEDRLINGYKNIDDVNFDIDFEKVERKLETLRGESLNYLKVALG